MDENLNPFYYYYIYINYKVVDVLLFNVKARAMVKSLSEKLRKKWKKNFEQ